MSRFARFARFAAPRTLSTRLAPAALAALLAACGGGGDKVTGPGPGASGRFSGSVAGAMTRSISGVAFYSQGALAGASVFALGMGSLKADSSFKDAVLIVREQAGVPAPGTYAFHDPESDAAQRPDEFGLIATLDMANAEGMACVGTEGTLTVQSAAGGRVRGTYAATASCVGSSELDEVVVTLSGTFDAVEDGRAAVGVNTRLAGRAERLARDTR